MNKTALLTDSACDIPPALEKELGIHMLNFSLAVDGRSYTDRVDFTPEEFVAILEKCEEIPRTSQVLTLRIIDEYEKLAGQGYTDIIHVTINSAGSATYDNACMAKTQFEEGRPGVSVHLLDSGSYSLAYGYPLICAAKQLEEGLPAAEVAGALRAIFAKTQVLLGLYTLRFAKKSGRISAAAAFAGELMGLKPIVLMDHEKTEILYRVRGDKKLLPTMLGHLKDCLPEGGAYSIAYSRPALLEEALPLCTEAIGYPPVFSAPMGACILTNAGPDAIGFLYAAR